MRVLSFFHTSKSVLGLWAWGYNGHGQIGDGGTTTYRNPTQIGTSTNWSTIAAGYGHTIALKTDGTLWAWGYNDYGQIGDGTTTDRNTPVQVSFSSSATVASAPSGVTATAGNSQVTVSWSDTSGATSYDIYYSTSSAVSTATGTKITCVTSPYIIPGLMENVTYYVIVVACNGYGDSTPSSTVSATPTSSSGGGGGTLTGTWKGNATYSFVDCVHKGTVTMSLTQSGSTLTGTMTLNLTKFSDGGITGDCGDTTKDTLNLTGTVSGSSITFSTPGTGDWTGFTGSATLSGDTITGELTGTNYGTTITLEFSVTRQ